LLGEANESLTLLGVGVLVHDDDSLRWGALVEPKRVARDHDGDDAETVERDAARLSLVDAPRHHALLAADIEVGVCETRAGPHIGGACFDISALSLNGDLVGRLNLRDAEDGNTESKDRAGKLAKHVDSPNVDSEGGYRSI